MTERPSSRETTRTAWGRIRRNVGILLGERAVFAIVNVIAAGVATRAIGLEGIGAIGLLLAYARLLADVAKFQSWQAIVRYGATAAASGERRELRRLVGLTLSVDICAVGIAIAAAWAGAVWLGPTLGWTPEMIAWAPWFCLIIAFLAEMTPTGVLRLFDRVPAIALNHALIATFRLGGATAVWLMGGGLFEMTLVWALSTIAAGLILYANAWATMRAEGATPRIGAAIRDGAAGFPGFWRFISATNVISTLDAVMPVVATLIIGALLGPAEAGVFHLVRQITEAMVRPGAMLGPLFMPELALMEAKGDRRAIRRMVAKTLIWSAGVLIAAVGVLVIFGDALLALLFGEAAASGHLILVLAGTAAAIYVWGFTLEPTLLSLGKAGKALWSVIAAWAVFAAIIFALMPGWGLLGVGIAMIGHRTTQFAIRLAMVARLLRRAPPVSE